MILQAVSTKIVYLWVVKCYEFDLKSCCLYCWCIPHTKSLNEFWLDIWTEIPTIPKNWNFCHFELDFSVCGVLGIVDHKIKQCNHSENYRNWSMFCKIKYLGEIYLFFEINNYILSTNVCICFYLLNKP